MSEAPKTAGAKGRDIAAWDVDQTSSAVTKFKPGVVYPYHYKGSDTQAFAEKVMGGGGG